MTYQYFQPLISSEAPTAGTVRASVLSNPARIKDVNSVNEKVLLNTQCDANSSYAFEGNQIRTAIINGTPWFIASDVCRAINIRNVSDALGKLDDDEKLTLGLTEAQKIAKMARDICAVSESGLYTLILRCRDAVKQGTLPWRFRKWVTAEVLPSIHKSGTYNAATVGSSRPSGVKFIRGQEYVLEFRDSSVTQLNALFVCTDVLRNDLWPHLTALFPGLKSQYGDTFATMAMVSGLLRQHKTQCKIIADQILGLVD